jgi:radical SAM superfamily enzyme YgiQ (UPF0313 family)
MNRPAFRSPAKIIQDIRNLVAQGVRFIGLYQDPRMGGDAYWRELLAGLAGESTEIERLSIDLLAPANEEFIRQVAKIGRQVVIHLCPDTGSDEVRNKLGRHYTNEDMMKTIKLCHKYHIPVTTFFSAGLAGETTENIQETWKLWEELAALDRRSQISGELKVPLGGPISGPIVIDPGSPAFDKPENFGYKLRYKTLEEYIAGLSQPAWHQWLNYETEELDNDGVVDLILSTVAFSIGQREKTGLYPPPQAAAERLKTEIDRVIVDEINQIMLIENKAERETAVTNLKNKQVSFLNSKIDPSFR